MTDAQGSNQQEKAASEAGNGESDACLVQEREVEALRALWATKDHETLFGEYNFVQFSGPELRPALMAFYDTIYSGEQLLDINRVLSEDEKTARSKLAERLNDAFHLYLGIFERDQFIGWCWGRQESPEQFHMVNTALLPEYRDRGIYTALLPEVLKITQEAGFQSVVSWHHPTNNRILIPKLKAGFVIAGFSVLDRFGLLVQLIYHFNATRRELLNYRVGYTGMSPAIESLLGR